MSAVCGGVIHWRQFQGMLLLTALGYSDRCMSIGCQLCAIEARAAEEARLRLQDAPSACDPQFCMKLDCPHRGH